MEKERIAQRQARERERLERRRSEGSSVFRSWNEVVVFPHVHSVRARSARIFIISLFHVSIARETEFTLTRSLTLQHSLFCFRITSLNTHSNTKVQCLTRTQPKSYGVIKST